MLSRERPANCGRPGPLWRRPPSALLDKAVIEAQGVVERVHFVVVQHADPVAQFADIDPQHLLEEDATFPAFDLGFWPGKAGAGRCRGGGDRHD